MTVNSTNGPNGFNLKINKKGQGITQALKAWGDTQKFDSSGDKIDAKEWEKTIEILKLIQEKRAATGGASLYKNGNINVVQLGDELKFSAEEQKDLMDAMGLSFKAPIKPEKLKYPPTTTVNESGNNVVLEYNQETGKLIGSTEYYTDGSIKYKESYVPERNCWHTERYQEGNVFDGG